MTKLEEIAQILAPQAFSVGYNPVEREWALVKARKVVEAIRDFNLGMAVDPNEWHAAIDTILEGK
jgi:hypothetical protein